MDAQVADTPAGKPLAPDTPLLLMPVAPVVVWVILVRAVLIHNVGVELADPAVLFGFTVICMAGEVLEQLPEVTVLRYQVVWVREPGV